MPHSVDVVVVGAGLAGLCTALHLHRAGLEVAVLEASDDVGGRQRTDEVDGFLLDRGFQLHNPAYPEAARVLDQGALDLRPFRAAVAVAVGGRRHHLGDPRRAPQHALSSLLAPVGSLPAKARFAAYALAVGYGDPARLEREPDVTVALALARRGLGGPLTDRVLRPFLSGVLGEGELSTSRLFVDLVLRSFVRGTPAVPADGIRAIPRQLAGRLPAGTVATHRPVRAVRSGAVDTDDGAVRARAVVVATGAHQAADLLPGLPVRRANALTTAWYAVDPAEVERCGLAVEPVLHVDGEARGPVVNSAVMSAVSPRYAPPGTALVAASALGARDDADLEPQVRAHLALVHGADTRRWRHLRTDVVREALPAMPPPLAVREPVALGDGLFVAGDHRDTSSIQGAMVSGRRAAAAVRQALGA